MPLSTPQGKLAAIIGVVASLFGIIAGSTPAIFVYGKLTERVETNSKGLSVIAGAYDNHFTRIEDHLSATDQRVNTATNKLEAVAESRAGNIVRLAKVEEDVAKLKLSIFSEIKNNTDQLLGRWQEDERTRSTRSDQTQVKLDSVVETLAKVSTQQLEANRRLDNVTQRLDNLLEQTVPQLFMGRQYPDGGRDGGSNQPSMGQ